MYIIYEARNMYMYVHVYNNDYVCNNAKLSFSIIYSFPTFHLPFCNPGKTLVICYFERLNISYRTLLHCLEKPTSNNGLATLANRAKQYQYP